MIKVSEKVTAKVLEITNSIYKLYEHRLYKTVLVHQDIKDVVLIGLADPDKKLNLTDEEKAKFQNYLDSGVLDETEEVPDWDVAKEYDKALDDALMLAIENGELPKYTLKLLKKKTRKYEKRLKTDNK